MLDDLLALLLLAATCAGATLVLFEARRLAREPRRRDLLSGEEAERDWFHNSVAALIATVSIAGALLAWRGSHVFGAAEGSNHAANQALVRDNDVTAIADSALDFGALQTLQLQERLAQANVLAERAAALRRGPDALSSSAQAEALEAQAAEERAVARVVGSGFVGIFSPHYTATGDNVVYDAAQVRATYRALNQDYRTLDAVQDHARTEATALHRTARRLVRIGILLTLTLFLLTMANLAALHQRLWMSLPAVVCLGVGFAVFVAVEGLAWSALPPPGGSATDGPDLEPPAGVARMVDAGAGVGAAATADAAATDQAAPVDDAAVDDAAVDDAATPVEHAPWPGGRLVTIVMVLTTLAAGTVGYFLNGANASASAAGAIAQREGVAASRQLVAGQQQAEADYATYVQMRSQQQRATTAFLLQRLSAGTATADVEGARSAAASAAAALSAASVPSDLADDAPTGPLLDATFPQRLFSSRAMAANELEAQQDAENELGAAWGRIGSDDTAVLTIFAVALFLLGSSLSLRGRPRLLFSGLGLTLVLVGLAWAVTVQLRSRPTVGEGEAAAHHYALGVQAYGSAARPAEFQEAIDEFDQAIALRPRFARAYFGRAQARVAHGNRELGLGFYISQVAPDDLRAAIADFSAAARYGQSDPTEQNDLGADQLLDWLQSGHGDLAVAEKQFRTAIAADPSSPLSYGNLGVTLLALGRAADAQAVFEQAVAQALQPSGATAPNAPYVEEQLLAATLSLLDNLGTSPAAASHPEFAAAIASQKERLVASMSHGSSSAPIGSVTIDRFGPLVVNPASVQVSFAPPAGYGDPTAGGRDLAGEDVSIQWYYRSTTDPRWTVIPAISGWGTTDPARASRSWNVALHWSSGTYFASLPFAGADCLPNGSYRAEVYVNGHLAGRTQTDATLLADMVQSRDPATAVGMCHPADWQRVAPPTVTSDDGTRVVLHGAVTGFGSPTSAVYALRFPVPHDVAERSRPASSTDTQEQYVAGLLSDDAMALLTTAGLPHVTKDLVAGKVIATDTYFMSTTDTRTTLYGNGTTTAVVTVGRAADGDELVGVVVGPTTDVSAALGGTINDLARAYYSLTRTG